MISMEKESRNVGSMSLGTAKPPHTNFPSRRTLWSRLKRGVDARARFVESNLCKNLAFQIRALRDREGWSQEQLGEKVGMNQNAISRLESPFYGKATLTTLKRIASAFDVALIVRFVPYGQLIDWVTGTTFVDGGMSSDSLCPAGFSAEVHTSALGSVAEKVLSHTSQMELGSIQRSGRIAGAESQLNANKQAAA